MSETSGSPAASSSHPTSADAASAISSAGTRSEASSPGVLRPEKPPLGTGGAIWLWTGGILLPAITLLLEVAFHLCAGVELFDPIPSWWHVALIATVPLVNFLTWRAVRAKRSASIPVLAHANAFAMGVSGVYAALFLPLTPFAIIGILFGVGLLALAPLLSFLAMVQARVALRRAFAPVPRVWLGFVAGVLSLLAPEGYRRATVEMMALAASEEPSASRRGVEWLRLLGSRAEMLRICYGTRSWDAFVMNFAGLRPGNTVSPEAAQKVFYRVTGDAFNSFPAPTAASVNRPGRGRWNFDSALGTNRVAGKVPGLSMKSSRLDGKVSAAAGVSYVEWTLVFSNIAANQSEARAQIHLPPGAVVSRLTLWIDGEPREAAFGGRAQVREAYQEVAVQQRRDPVLVTTAGPDRVLMQCFPVPPNGGEMKVRLGISAPLRVTASGSGEAMLPTFLETNFEQADDFAHDLWLEADRAFEGGGATVRRPLRDEEFAKAPRWKIAVENREASQWAEIPGDAGMAIRQSLRQREVVRPRHVAIVVDGSKSMTAELAGIAALLPKLPSVERLSVIFAGDEPEVFESRGDLSELGNWLRARNVAGGRDNLPALERAWDAVAGKPGGAIVWLHGPQPVLLGNIERLLQRTEREKTPPEWFDVTGSGATNRVLEQLDQFRPVRTVRAASTLPGNFAHLLATWRGEAAELEYVREKLPRAEAPADFAPQSGHITRLWAAEEVGRLLAGGAKGARDQAMKLAVALQLVTPVSGAVVLERQEQYDRHGLTPADVNSVPMVPEPGTGLMLILGGGALLMRRWRRSAGAAAHTVA